MYRPEIKRKRSGAPVLSRKEIDVIGQNIVGDFMPEALKSPQEIDIDLLAQDYLGMDQDFQYLSHCGVYLGMTVFNDTDTMSNRPSNSGAMSRPLMRLPVPLVSMRVKIFSPLAFIWSMTQQMSSNR